MVGWPGNGILDGRMAWERNIGWQNGLGMEYGMAEWPGNGILDGRMAWERG